MFNVVFHDLVPYDTDSNRITFLICPCAPEVGIEPTNTWFKAKPALPTDSKLRNKRLLAAVIFPSVGASLIENTVYTHGIIFSYFLCGEPNYPGSNFYRPASEAFGGSNPPTLTTTKY
jgi:hypothetical protein